MSVQRFRAVGRPASAFFDRSQSGSLYSAKRALPFLLKARPTLGSARPNVTCPSVPLATKSSSVKISRVVSHDSSGWTSIQSQTTIPRHPPFSNRFIIPDGVSSLRLPIPGGKEVELSGTWLRDNCRCKECLHPDTKQRLVDTFSIPLDIRPSSIINHRDHLEIKWPNGHISMFDYKWLESHRAKRAPEERFSTFRENLKQGPKDTNYQPSVDYDEVMSSEEGVRKWTSQIYDYGYSFVEGCPATPEATQKLLERISFIRPTHYGAFWDFTSDLKMKDMAYTTGGLGAHTDTTYFTEPAGLQMFHLLSHTDGKGGESLLVDGFAAAKQLYHEDLVSYRDLSKEIQGSHASGNEDVCIQPARPFPVLNHLPFSNELFQVRWNNEDRAPKCHSNAKKMGNWYRAAMKFDQIIKRDSMQRWFQLKPGTPLIFDNWRMLHGRSAFTGKRRVCGGYINHDDFMSRYRLLNYGRQSVLDSV